MHPHFYLGTSNIVIPLRQRDFPPAFAGASRLTYYASLLNSVEINATFYKLPKAATIAKWATEVPAHFRFTFKLYKAVTHKGGLQFEQKDLIAFADVLSGAAAHKGCVLVQLPPSVKADKMHALDHLLQSFAAYCNGEWPVAVEVRHPSWYHPETYRLLQEHSATLVMHDKKGSVTPMTEDASPFYYVRFHGPDGRYGGSYSDEDLEHYAVFMHTALQKGKTVYCYFNNTLGGALSNAQTLYNLIAAQQQTRV